MTVRRRQAISRVLASQMGAVARENDRSRDRGLLKCPILKADTCRECDGLMVTCQTVPEVSDDLPCRIQSSLVCRAQWLPCHRRAPTLGPLAGARSRRWRLCHFCILHF
jgi:hypothetical protein